MLQAEYSPAQAKILDELFHQGRLSPESLAEFQDAFTTVYAEAFAAWWDNYGWFGRSPTDQELNSLFDTSFQEAQRRWLLSHGLNSDGSRVIGARLDRADENGAVIEVPSTRPKPEPTPPPNFPTDNGTKDYPPPPSRSTAEIRRDFRQQIRNELGQRLGKALESTRNAAQSMFGEDAIKTIQTLRPSAEKIRELVIDEAKGKAVDWAEKLVPGVGIAAEATGVFVGFVTEYRNQTAKPALQRNPTSRLLGRPEDLTVRNFISSATTDERAREVGRNKTVWQDAAGNWYVDNDPNFTPKGPFQQVWRPRRELYLTRWRLNRLTARPAARASGRITRNSRGVDHAVKRSNVSGMAVQGIVGPNSFGADPNAHQLQIVRGNATPRDRPAVSTAQVFGKVAREYAKDKFIDLAKEKLKERVLGPSKP